MSHKGNDYHIDLKAEKEKGFIMDCPVGLCELCGELSSDLEDGLCETCSNEPI